MAIGRIHTAAHCWWERLWSKHGQRSGIMCATGLKSTLALVKGTRQGSKREASALPILELSKPIYSCGLGQCGNSLSKQPAHCWGGSQLWGFPTSIIQAIHRQPCHRLLSAAPLASKAEDQLAAPLSASQHFTGLGKLPLLPTQWQRAEGIFPLRNAPENEDLTAGEATPLLPLLIFQWLQPWITLWGKTLTTHLPLECPPFRVGAGPVPWPEHL